MIGLKIIQLYMQPSSLSGWREASVPELIFLGVSLHCAVRGRKHPSTIPAVYSL